MDSLLALGDGRAQLAIASADLLAQAVNGEGPFEGRTVSARTMATLYTNRLHLLVPGKSAISGLSELRGQTIGTGPEGSGMRLTLDRALEVALLKDRVTTESRSWPELKTSLDEGRLGAIAWLDGVPSPAITRAERPPGQLRVLNSASAVPLLERRYGRSLYQQAEIPAAAYGLDGPADSVGVSAVLVARHDLGDTAGFTVTSALFRLSRALAEACPAIAGLEPSSAARSQPAALHAGAALFYRQSADDSGR